MGTSKFFWVAIFIALLGSIVFLTLQYFSVQKELESTKVVVASQRYNEPTINFLKMFIKRIIKSDKEVDFETRLKLENAVRDLNDEQILARWQRFVNSQTEAEAQANVKELLDSLVDKIYIR